VIPAQSADVVVSAPESPVPVAKVPRRAREPIADDRLAEEAALLIRAEKDYHAGKLHKALATTEEHARTFPAGVLRRERVKLRNNIVCQMSADQGSKTPPSSAYPANAGTVSAARCER